LTFFMKIRFLSPFSFSFARMKCTYQGKTHCPTKESLKASYGIMK
jgi:hypothetical protein